MNTAGYTGSESGSAIDHALEHLADDRGDRLSRDFGAIHFGQVRADLPVVRF
jgi:hypothetical protein